jgi:hypothetical protein
MDPSTSSEPSPRLATRRDPVVRGFVLGVAGMAATLVLAFAVSKTLARPRAGHAAAPAAPLTQGPFEPPPPDRRGASGDTVDTAEAEAKAALERDPEDVNARLELARIRLDKEDYMSVQSETERVLKGSPGNARAIAYQSQVRLMMGQPQVAVDMLRQAVAKEPTFLQAYIYLSYAYLSLGQQAEAKAAIEAGKRQYPAQSAWLESGFAQLKADIEKFGPPFPTGAANPHGNTGANPHAPGPSDPRPTSGTTVGGQLELDASLEGTLPAGAVVFVTIRDAGSSGGPPVAAKRLPASFPCAFEIGQADSMQGGPIPERLAVEARVDADGDASTREPSDPIARLDGVRAGTTGLRLVLVRR